MKHQKEWRTCDRCGKEIIFYNKEYAYFKTEELEPFHKKNIYTAEDLAKQTLPMAIWRNEHQYDLCSKCRKDFKRFMRKREKNVCRYQERCCVWMKRTRIKSTKSKLKNIRLFTDFGGIGFYKIIKIYEWKEYCNNAVTPSGSHWFKCSMAKIKTESGVIMKIPFIELGMKSVYADTGERVLK